MLDTALSEGGRGKVWLCPRVPAGCVAWVEVADSELLANKLDLITLTKGHCGEMMSLENLALDGIVCSATHFVTFEKGGV